MKAAWYERQGPPSEVLVVGEMTTPDPGPGEVRIRVEASGVNPGDVKKRTDQFGLGMPFPRVIPHSDGAGVIEDVGDRVSSSRARISCIPSRSRRGRRPRALGRCAGVFGAGWEQAKTVARQRIGCVLWELKAGLNQFQRGVQVLIGFDGDDVVALVEIELSV